jgi:imidazolonepropionase-like amidohydrolase
MTRTHLRTVLSTATALLAIAPLLSPLQTQAADKKPIAKPTGPHPIVLTGGKVLTVSHGTLDRGVVVMADGKITAVGDVGKVSVPKGAEVVDTTGMTVYPGLIDSETTLGLVEVESDAMNRDLVERSDEIMPNMHVYDAFHAETERIPVARLNGITNAIVAPASDDTLPGQDIFIQLAGANRDAMILKRDWAMPLNFGSDQRRNQRGQTKFPETRMGLASQLRQSFLDAQAYGVKKRAAEDKHAEWEKNGRKGEEPSFKRELKQEALLPYLAGERTVVLGASEGHDIETAMAIAREFHLKVVLNHATHSQQIFDEIASWKVPVVFGSIYDFPMANERYDSVYATPGELTKRGVRVAFSSGAAGGEPDAQFTRNLPYAAGMAVAYGMPYDDALRAITLTPAEIWGVDKELGSLDPGKTANVVVANGDPLDVRTDVKQVYIQGQAIPMVSRQTTLRDEYARPAVAK